MSIPLTTERLALRAFDESDLDRLLSLDGDPEVMRFLDHGPPPTRDHLRKHGLQRFIRPHPGTGRPDYWAVCESVSGEFIGWIEFRPVADTNTSVVELGYRLAKAAWGRGYATECALALIRKGFCDWGVQSVIANAMAVNHRSRRVMEKSGLTHVRTAFDEWPDYIEGAEFGDVHYELTRSQWRARNSEKAL
ncbi:GNAT family N-acetyltransferase [Streptomyces sp. NPDC005963]|uniref:GNAT family N-acetyltransferase n=1 Tax=Streptomyces sp. NPDC005963 TaxID=3156721 RepID=UPI0033FF6157